MGSEDNTTEYEGEDKERYEITPGDTTPVSTFGFCFLTALSIRKCTRAHNEMARRNLLSSLPELVSTVLPISYPPVAENNWKCFFGLPHPTSTPCRRESKY